MYCFVCKIMTIIIIKLCSSNVRYYDIGCFYSIRPQIGTYIRYLRAKQLPTLHSVLFKLWLYRIHWPGVSEQSKNAPLKNALTKYLKDSKRLHETGVKGCCLFCDLKLLFVGFWTVSIDTVKMPFDFTIVCIIDCSCSRFWRLNCRAAVKKRGVTEFRRVRVSINVRATWMAFFVVYLIPFCFYLYMSFFLDVRRRIPFD